MSVLMHIHKSTRMQVCGAADAGASKTDTEEKKCI